MEYSAKTTLPLNSNGIIYPLPVFHKLSMVWPLTCIYFTIWGVILGPKGEKMQEGSQYFPFLAINAKEGEIIKPKAKGPHQHFKKFRNEFSIGIYFSINLWK